MNHWLCIVQDDRDAALDCEGHDPGFGHLADNEVVAERTNKGSEFSGQGRCGCLHEESGDTLTWSVTTQGLRP